MNENIEYTIDKFVKYKFTINELKEVAPVIQTEAFAEQFEFSQHIQVAIKDEVREKLKDSIRTIVESENKVVRMNNLANRKDKTFLAVAAAVIVICSIAAVLATTGYNNESNFRKTYIEINNGK
jgi:hypothetical protein